MLMKDRYMYFLYSPQQHKMRSEIASNLGKTYIPGTVNTGSEWKTFTEKSDKNYNRYADSVVVFEGYLRDCEYIESSNEWRS